MERQGDDTKSSTAVLLRRYHKDSDTSARHRLIELYLPLVESFARRYSRSSNDYEDLYQVGCIGLINAIDRFDLERGEELNAAGKNASTTGRAGTRPVNGAFTFTP